MKGRHIPAPVESEGEDAMRHAIVRIRLAEVLAHAPALRHGGARELHDLRIACKRLRYSLELHREALPPSAPAAEHVLVGMQDLLGEVHDCDVLVALAKKGDGGVTRAVRRDRNTLLARARRLWSEAFEDEGALTALAVYAGFGSPQGAAGGAP